MVGRPLFLLHKSALSLGQTHTQLPWSTGPLCGSCQLLPTMIHHNADGDGHPARERKQPPQLQTVDPQCLERVYISICHSKLCQQLYNTSLCGWRGGSAVKKEHWVPLKRTKVRFPHGDSWAPLTLVPEDPSPTLGLHRHSTHMVQQHKCGKAFTHIKIIMISSPSWNLSIFY